MKIKQVLFLTSLIFLISLSVSSPTFASSNFTTDYKVNYLINENGSTHSTLSIVLTNTTAKVYASSYQMQLGFDQISNIKASDELGPINTTINKTPEGYNLSLALNRKAIGLGTKLPFKLEFDTESVAKNSGNVWEINIPGIANPANFSSFVVTVKAPDSFGSPSIIKPVTTNKDLTFDKEQLRKSGISIAYGSKQSYDYNLIYHLRNTNVYPVKTEIALPADTNYQKSFINQISPRPNNVIIDSDGNWLAQYNLSPNQKEDIRVIGSVELNLNPISDSITRAQLKEFTSQTKYWQSNNPKIQKLAKELKTPGAIYDYVVKTLRYDFRHSADSNKRLGALSALDNPGAAVCREFTDLFIAIARAAGIPTREVDGFAYTANTKQRPLSLVQDVLHAWPEYYDLNKKTWVMVDPTWGSTTGGVDYFNTLDFDHIAFVVKGKDDNYPIPAGGYKSISEKSLKDVEVKFSNSNNKKKQNVELSSSLGNQQIAGFPINFDIKIVNNGPASLPKTTLYIDSTQLTPAKQAFEIPEIPPYGYLNIKGSLDKTSILINKESAVKIRYLEKSITTKIRNIPFFLNIYGIGGVVIGIFTLIILIIAGKSGRLRLHR